MASLSRKPPVLALINVNGGLGLQRRYNCCKPAAKRLNLTHCSTIQYAPEHTNDTKITLVRSPLQQTRTATQQSELEAYFKHISGSALNSCPALADLLQATSGQSRAYMASPTDTLAVVQNIVRLSNAKRCIEIGVYTGVIHLHSLRSRRLPCSDRLQDSL